MTQPYGIRRAQLEDLADQDTDACVIWPFAVDIHRGRAWSHLQPVD